MRRVVVDDLSLQRFGNHNRVAHELELPSASVASKLTQAGCEIATKKSKVLGNSASVRAKLQLRLAPFGVQATRAERNFGIDFTSGKRASTAVRRAQLEKSEGRVRRIRKIHGKSSVPLWQRPARIANASVSKVDPLWRCSHWAQRDAVAAVTVSGGTLLGEAAAWEKVSRWC